MKSKLFALLACFAAVFAVTSAQAAPLAAITWDFTDITGEMTGLGTALVAAVGLVIAAGLVLFGTYRAWGVISKMFNRVVNK